MKKLNASLDGGRVVSVSFSGPEVTGSTYSAA